MVMMTQFELNFALMDISCWIKLALVVNEVVRLTVPVASITVNSNAMANSNVICLQDFV